jgi:hypothetical protein
MPLRVLVLGPDPISDCVKTQIELKKLQVTCKKNTCQYPQFVHKNSIFLKSLGVWPSLIIGYAVFVPIGVLVGDWMGKRRNYQLPLSL